MSLSTTAIWAFRLQAWRRNVGNFSLIKHRHCDGHLLSMHQSGTHWLKFMLANALSHQYGTPPPAYNHANDIIGGPRDRPRYPQLPRIISSHSIAHPLLALSAVHRRLSLPPYVVLVRDLREALISNYMKWRGHYGISFSDYLRGDPRGRRFNSDIWWALRFLNAWGDVRQCVPARVLVVRYEDLRRDPSAELERIAVHFGIALDAQALRHGVAQSSKSAMMAKDDPARPPGAVREADADARPLFTAADRAFLHDLCGACLRHDFGYDYRDL